MRRKGKTGGGSNKPRGNSGKKPGMFNRPKSGASPKSSSPVRNPTNKGNPIALILGIFFAVAAIAGITYAVVTGGTLIPLPPIGSDPNLATCNVKGKVRVNALTALTVIPFDLSIEPKSTNKNYEEDYMPVTVALGEGEKRSIGPMIQASGNLAAVMTSLLLGRADMGNCEFKLTIDPENYTKMKVLNLDGPSAGALFTSGFISIVRGETDKVSTNKAMTGTINPDGTVGFVGKIPEKIQAYIKFADSKKMNSSDYKVITPKQNFPTSIAKGNLSKVQDIYSAYEEITGIRLPRYMVSEVSSDRLASFSSTKLKIDKNIQSKLEDTASNIKGKVDIAMKRVVTGSNEIPTYLKPFIEIAGDHYSAFEAAKGDDNTAKMYTRISYADAYYSILELSLNDVRRGIEKNDSLTAKEKNDRLIKLFAEKINKVVDSPEGSNVKELEKNIKDNLGNLSYSSAIDAYISLARLNSQASFYTKEKTWNKFFENVEADKRFNALAIALIIPELLDLDIKYAKFNYSIGTVPSSNDKVSMSLSRANVSLSLIRLLKKGGIQNLNFIEAYVKELRERDASVELPREYDILSETREKLEASEESLSSSIKSNEKFDDIHKVLEPLGYAISLFIDSSVLVQKHYALQIDPRYYTSIPSLTQQQQQNLTKLLEFGENESKILINALKDKKVPVDVPTFNYMKADSWKDSINLENKFYSVLDFWNANLESRISLFLLN